MPRIIFKDVKVYTSLKSYKAFDPSQWNGRPFKQNEVIIGYTTNARYIGCDVIVDVVEADGVESDEPIIVDKTK